MSTLPRIQTLEQLAKIIHSGPGYATIGEMLNQVDLSEQELDARCRWSKDAYQQVLIEEGDTYELLLMCWEPGQASPIHDHAGSQSWIRVLKGELKETLFYRPSEPGPLEVQSSGLIKEGGLSYFNDDLGIHRISNAAEGRTISLHYYVSPVTKVKVYDEQTGEFRDYRLH